MRIQKTSETRALAGNIVNAYNDSQTSAYSCEYLNPVILWTNSNPTSSFASQNITLSSSDYDMYEIIYKNYTTEDYYMNTGKIPQGHGNRIMMMGGSGSGPYTYKRDVVYNSATSLAIGDCISYYGSTSSTNNSQAIPLYIIGYKTGLFN